MSEADQVIETPEAAQLNDGLEILQKEDVTYKKGLTRRQFCKLAGSALVGWLLSGCWSLEAPSSAEEVQELKTYLDVEQEKKLQSTITLLEELGYKEPQNFPVVLRWSRLFSLKKNIISYEELLKKQTKSNDPNIPKQLSKYMAEITLANSALSGRLREKLFAEIKGRRIEGVNMQSEKEKDSLAIAQEVADVLFGPYSAAMTSRLVFVDGGDKGARRDGSRASDYGLEIGTIVLGRENSKDSREQQGGTAFHEHSHNLGPDFNIFYTPQEQLDLTLRLLEYGKKLVKEQPLDYRQRLALTKLLAAQRTFGPLPKTESAQNFLASARKVLPQLPKPLQESFNSGNELSFTLNLAFDEKLYDLPIARQARGIALELIGVNYKEFIKDFGHLWTYVLEKKLHNGEALTPEEEKITRIVFSVFRRNDPNVSLDSLHEELKKKNLLPVTHKE